MDKTVINCTTGVQTIVPLTQDEIDAHAAAKSREDARRAAELADSQEMAPIEIDFQAVRTKAKAVFNGTDTFTNVQAQKLVAGLVLRATRNL